MTKLGDDFDVVVCGAGGAGAAAAIEAHDHGASVVVLEKARSAGGSTAESGGSLATIADRDGAIEHYLAITEGRTPRAVIAAYVDGVLSLPSWLAAEGGATQPLPLRPPAFPTRYPGTAYSDLPHATAIGERVIVRGGPHGGTTLWRFLQTALERRGIPVRFDTPARRLLRTAGGTICGVRTGPGDGGERVPAPRRRAGHGRLRVSTRPAAGAHRRRARGVLGHRDATRARVSRWLSRPGPNSGT